MQVNGSVVRYNVVVGSVVVDLMFIVAPIMGVLFFHALLNSAMYPFQLVALLCLFSWCLVNAPL